MRITMCVDSTTKVFNLLVLLLICMLLSSHFFSSRKAIILIPIVLTINGVAISIYGIVQRLSDNPTIYGLGTPGNPFGPFINKNNAAGYLLICLAGCLAASFVIFRAKQASGGRPRPIITKEYPIWKRISLHFGLFLAELTALRIVALLATSIIVLGIIFTLSRGGTLALAVGSGFAVAYYALTQKSSAVVLIVGTIALALVGLTISFGWGDLVAKRLGSLSDVKLLENESRVDHWIQTAPAITDFTPLGCGVGLSLIHI